MQLWASCPTVEASAPRVRPKPCTQPRPMRPVCRCRSTTASRATSAAGSAGSVISDAVDSEPARMPMVRAQWPGSGGRCRRTQPGGGVVRCAPSGAWKSGAGACRSPHPGRPCRSAPPAVPSGRPGRAGSRPACRSRGRRPGSPGRGRRARVEAVVLGRVGGGHHQGVDLADPGPDGQVEAVVHVAHVQQGVGLPVVAAQRHVIGAMGQHHRDEVEQVLAGRALADEDPHPLAPLLLRLGQLGALVVGLDAGGQVRIEGVPRTPGA